MTASQTVDFVEDRGRAAAVLHPLRIRILEALSEPDSATGLSRRLLIPRQKANYHLQALFKAGFLESAGQRKKGNMLEHRYRTSAQGYVLSPELLGSAGADVERVEDRFSAAYLLALGSQMQSELGRSLGLAQSQNKRLATLSLSSELRFETPQQRAQFADALRQAVLQVIRQHASPARRADGAPAAGRPYRLTLGCYPIPPQKQEEP